MVDLLTGSGYLIVIGAVVLCFAGLGFYLMWKKNQYRFSFRLWSSDMKNSRLIKGRIKTDDSNKKYQYFAFKDNNTRLEITSPTTFENGKPVRQITYSDTGDYTYIEGVSLDKTKTLNFELKPTHKTLYLQMLKDNQTKYPLLNKGLMLSYGALIIVGLLIVVGFIYTFATNVRQADQLIQLSNKNSEVIEAMEVTARSLVESSNAIYSATSLLYNGSINRPLAPVNVGVSAE